MIATLKRALAIKFAPFVVMDNYGTRQYAWTMLGAYEWLSFCSDAVVIVNTYNKSVILRRKQGNGSNFIFN